MKLPVQAKPISRDQLDGSHVSPNTGINPSQPNVAQCAACVGTCRSNNAHMNIGQCETFCRNQFGVC